MHKLRTYYNSKTIPGCTNIATLFSDTGIMEFGGGDHKPVAQC